jgi:hypothetical protein
LPEGKITVHSLWGKRGTPTVEYAEVAEGTQRVRMSKVFSILKQYFVTLCVLCGIVTLRKLCLLKDFFLCPLTRIPNRFYGHFYLIVIDTLTKTVIIYKIMVKHWHELSTKTIPVFFAVIVFLVV